MAGYRLLIKPSAVKEIETAPGKDRLHIVKDVQDLSPDPRPAGWEKFSGHDERYRVRQGTYRVVHRKMEWSRVASVPVSCAHSREGKSRSRCFGERIPVIGMNLARVQRELRT